MPTPAWKSPLPTGYSRSAAFAFFREEPLPLPTAGVAKPAISKWPGCRVKPIRAFRFGPQRIMEQGDSARDYDASASMKSAEILNVFPNFRTARLRNTIRRSPQSPLCGVAFIIRDFLFRCNWDLPASGVVSFRFAPPCPLRACIPGQNMIYCVEMKKERLRYEANHRSV